MAFLASRPSGVFAATAARSMSPVARWHRQFSFLIIGLWVPLPEPGGPAAGWERHAEALVYAPNRHGMRPGGTVADRAAGGSGSTAHRSQVKGGPWAPQAQC